MPNEMVVKARRRMEYRERETLNTMPVWSASLSRGHRRIGLCSEGSG